MTQMLAALPATLAERLSAMRAYFEGGVTRSVATRKRALEALEAAIRREESVILEALAADLGKSAFEGYATEVGLVLAEVRYLRRHLGRWVRPKAIWPSLAQLPGRAYLQYEPRGVVLIMAPWNYPFQLLMIPLAGALAAGNVVVLKPSEFAPHTAAVVEKLIGGIFPAEYVSVIQGDAEVASGLLDQDWDYIFFTGSTRVGQIVAEKAARRLIPYTLELGGKSPAIVTARAHLATSARRIVWGKWVNAGQTCIAPDYVLLQEEVLEPFIKAAAEAIEAFAGASLAVPPAEYSRIVHRRHFDRLLELMQEGQVVYGGYYDAERLYVSPTLLLSPRGRLLEEEIFGPLLPIIPYRTLEEARAFLRKFPPPLASYVFTESKAEAQFFLEAVPAGGSCINDTLMHIGSSRLPFGGVRQSGIGRYHGWYSFETFSHARAIVKTPTWLDLPFRYPPYKNKLSLIKWLLG